jgi:hypothetical protein
MNEQIQNAIKWIDELLTTQTKQGKGKLGNAETGFCCLGLGCSILDVPYQSEDSFDDGLTIKVGLHDAEGGFFDERGDLLYLPFGTDSWSSLANANDSEVSFRDIGKTMRDKPTTVFEQDVASGIIAHYKSSTNA